MGFLGEKENSFVQAFDESKQLIMWPIMVDKLTALEQSQKICHFLTTDKFCLTSSSSTG